MPYSFFLNMLHYLDFKLQKDFQCKNKKILCTLYSVALNGNICKTVLQYHNITTETDIVKMGNISITRIS